MYSATPQRLSGCAYMTYAVRYATRLYPSFQLVDVPIALAPSLQSPPLGGVKPGIASAGRNTCSSAPSSVPPLCTATPSASMPAEAMLGTAALRNTAASVGLSRPCPAMVSCSYTTSIWLGSLPACLLRLYQVWQRCTVASMCAPLLECVWTWRVLATPCARGHGQQASC